jgi:hypothetical protein
MVLDHEAATRWYSILCWDTYTSWAVSIIGWTRVSLFYRYTTRGPSAGNWTVFCTVTRVRGILSLTLATRPLLYCKNVVQLRTFGEVQVWLETYFLEPSAGSYIQHDMQLKSYPRDSTDNKFALWLLCQLGTSSRYHHCDVTHIRIFVLDADKSTFSSPSDLYTEILRSYAIGANRVCLYSCSNSIPSSLRKDISIP